MYLPPLLTDADLARTFRTTPATVRRLTRSDGLPHVELPKVGVRFLAEDVERWVHEHQHPKEATDGSHG